MFASDLRCSDCAMGPWGWYCAGSAVADAGDWKMNFQSVSEVSAQIDRELDPRLVNSCFLHERIVSVQNVTGRSFKSTQRNG